MSNLSNTRSVRSIYPARLLLIDYGLNEKTVDGICHGLDQLFSIITTYIGLQHVPMFGLIVNGQNQSEIFIPLSSTCNSHMELQIALYKLQLLAQKWSIKSTSSLSWYSALQLASTEINNNKKQITTDVELIILTNRLSNSIISDIDQFTKNHQFDKKKIELGYVNDDDNIKSFKQNRSLLDLINIKYILDNKYSISLYFKSWLINNDHENEHLQLYLPTIEKTEHIDQSWHMIRCDLQKILIDPHHHINHDRFFIYPEPSILTGNSSSLSLPIYQLKALNFIKQTNYCISMIFGMPLFVISTTCQKYDMEKNRIAFDTLIEYLHQNELMLICRLNDCSITSQLFSGHFILSVASEGCLILRSIASSELLLPFPIISHRLIKHEQKQIDEKLIHSLSNMNIEDEEYNPLYYESRKSKITLNTNLI